MVVSPRGDVLHECGTDEEIAKERGSEPTFSEFEIAVYDQFLEHFKEERD